MYISVTALEKSQGSDTFLANQKCFLLVSMFACLILEDRMDEISYKTIPYFSLHLTVLTSNEMTIWQKLAV